MYEYASYEVADDDDTVTAFLNHEAGKGWEYVNACAVVSQYFDHHEGTMKSVETIRLFFRRVKNA
jgi:hypothetical protein